VNRRFRLWALERLREGKLAEAARALGLARRAVSAAQQEQARVHAELIACDAPRQAAPPYAVGLAATRRERLREDLVKAGARVSEARGHELCALAGWNAARSDLRAVETLHERHRLALADADARAEQRLMDELAANTARIRPSGREPAEET
jgi:flagellar biosynthesis chaperone FliJ